MAAATHATDQQQPRIAEVERRYYRKTVALRAADAADGMPKLQGYAAVFNEETMIGSSQWGFRERIAPGAFAAAITEDDVRGLFNHDDNQVLGRTKSGTLRLAEDETGLKYEIDPPDTVLGRDLLHLVERGDIDGSSFAFTVEEDKWEYPSDKNDNTRPLRTLLKVRLFDVSPVTYPAYPQTSVSARAKTMATTQHATDEEARGRRDDGAGAGSVPDDGGMEASAQAIQKAIRKVASAKKAVRSMIKALDISHGFNPLTGNLAGQGGAQLDTGRTKLSHKERKALKRRMRAIRDRVVGADTGSGSVASDSTSATMYYSARSAYRTLLGTHHAMNAIRAMSRSAGLDLTANAGESSGGASGGGDGSAMGSDAGSGGANTAHLADLDLRDRELEMERLR